jgi:kinesin family protein 2/24
VPFKERIRPSMVVAWRPTDETASYVRPDARNLVLIMAPEPSAASDANASDSEQYRCAVMYPGVTAGSFDLFPWYQVVVSVTQMQAEVLMQYDTTLRCYFEDI